MEYSGKNYRSLADSSGISFDLGFSLNSQTGVASFGFSGENNSIEFNLVSGKIYDPENRYVHSYQLNNDTYISGNISGTNYNYYINEEPICFVGQRSDFKVQRFFLDTTGCNLDLKNFSIYSDPFEYSLEFQKEFKPTSPITGTLKSKNPDKNFKIFSGKITSPANFSISGFDTGNSNSAKITVLPADGTTINNAFKIESVFHTNFGKIYKNFDIKSIPLSPYESNFILMDIYRRNNSYSGTSTTGVNFGYDLSGEKVGDYILVYDSYLSGVEVTGAKEIDLSFSHLSGYTGTFYRVTGIQVVSGGSGFITPVDIGVSGTYESIETTTSPLVTFAVTGIELTSSGSGYTSMPSITISGGLGNGAAASGLTGEGIITGVVILSGGSGYQAYPDVDFIGGHETGVSGSSVFAEGNSMLGNGIIKRIDLIEGGVYFSGQPTIYSMTGSAGMGSGASLSLLTQSFEKTFTGSWNISTGLYYGQVSQTLNDLIHFRETGYLENNNTIYHNPIAGTLNSGESLAIRITNINNYDKNIMTAFLSVSGLGNKYIQEIMTGIK